MYRGCCERMVLDTCVRLTVTRVTRVAFASCLAALGLQIEKCIFVALLALISINSTYRRQVARRGCIIVPLCAHREALVTTLSDYVVQRYIYCTRACVELFVFPPLRLAH